MAHTDMNLVDARAYAGLMTIKAPRTYTSVERILKLLLIAVVGLVVLCVLTSAIGRLAGWQWSPMSLLVIPVAAGMIYLRWRRSVKLLRDELAAAGPSLDAATIQGAVTLAEGFESGQRATRGRNTATMIARALRDASSEPLALRVIRKGDELAAATPPFNEFFEPTPLDRTDPRLSALSGRARESAWPMVKEVPVDEKDVRSAYQLTGYAALAAIAVFFAITFLIALVQGRNIAGWTVAVPLFILAQAVLPALMRLFRPEEWLLVPGGVLIRRRSWKTSRWKLTELYRENSTPVLFEPEAAVGIASAEGDFGRGVTAAEAEALLLAWFSEAPRQPLERMSDLK